MFAINAVLGFAPALRSLRFNNLLHGVFNRHRLRSCLRINSSAFQLFLPVLLKNLPLRIRTRILFRGNRQIDKVAVVELYTPSLGFLKPGLGWKLAKFFRRESRR